ncbi:MAG: hypothetical protein R6X02_25500 [Enhygromyxa sp.]
MMHNRGLPTRAEREQLIYCRGLLNHLADQRTRVADPEQVGSSR